MFYLLKTLLFIDVLMVAGLLLFRWAVVPAWQRVVSGRIVALALLTPAAALFCGNIYLFCLYLALVVAFNARSRTELAGTYLFLLPLLPPLSVETGVGGVYLFAISAVGAMGLGALVGFLVTGTRGAPTAGRHDLAVWALIAIFVYMSGHDGNATALLRVFLTNFVSFVGPYYLVSRAARTRADLDLLLLRLSLGATIMAGTACFQARRHWALFEIYFQTLRVPLQIGSAATSMRAGMMRTGGSMLDYSMGGLFLAAIITVMPLLRRSFRPVGFWAVIAVLLGGLIVTQSRGAWLAGIVGLATVGAWRGRWGRVAILVGGAAAAEAAVLLFAKSGALASILGNTEEAGGNVDYRHRLATRGMDQIIAHPLLGQSPQQLVANMPDLTQGQHIVDFVNGHLFVAMAAGVPLFLVWCWVWLMPLVETWRRRGSDPTLAAIPAALIVPPLVALTFTSISDRNLTWPLVGLAMTSGCLAFARAKSAGRRIASTGYPALPPFVHLPTQTNNDHSKAAL